MSKANFGFRTGRLPLRPRVPWLPILMTALAIFAWLWALVPRDQESFNLSQNSITQSPSPVKGENPTPAPQEECILETESVTLFAVQISAHADEASALSAQEAAQKAGLTSCLYRQEETYKLLDSLCATQEEADMRKAELAAIGREAYVFTWEIPAMQVKLQADRNEAEIWGAALVQLTDAARSPIWAQEEEAAYTAKGLSDTLCASAEALRELSDAQAATLAEVLEACAAQLLQGDTLRSASASCAIAVKSYITGVLGG